MLDMVGPRQIRRDPFGRRSLMREVQRVYGRQCVNCVRRARFRYEWESDDARHPVSMRYALPFCGIKCFDAYYGE